MEKYADKNKDSNISGYEMGPDFVRVFFKDGNIYLYNNARTGAASIAQMKLLAQKGSGLNSFINKYVRKKYAKREQ